MKKLGSVVNFKLNEKLDNDLKKAYLEALENSDFKDLVSELHMPLEILMKYTSSLEEASLEYSHCKHCKNLLSCKNKINGYCYLPKVDNDKLSFCYQACSYKIKLDKENEYLKNIYIFNMPEEIKKARMKDIYMDDVNRFEVIKYLTEFIKNYKKNPKQKGLYLYGSFGSGKTYLVSAAFNELAKKGVKSAIVFWPDMLSELKNSFSNGNFGEKIDFLKKVPLLLIDDIGAEVTTSWSRDEVFCPIVQYRMQEGLSTFFTSNLTKKELENHFSTSRDGVEHIKARRIIERINQLTNEVSLISKNLRG